MDRTSPLQLSSFWLRVCGSWHSKCITLSIRFRMECSTISKLCLCGECLCVCTSRTESFTDTNSEHSGMYSLWLCVLCVLWECTDFRALTTNFWRYRWKWGTQLLSRDSWTFGAQTSPIAVIIAFIYVYNRKDDTANDENNSATKNNNEKKYRNNNKIWN